MKVKALTATAKFILVASVVFVLAFSYVAYRVFSSTTIGTTITTNLDLEDGLVGHWTFDGKDIDMSNSTAEILDRSGSGNNGNWINHATTTRPGKLGQAIEFDGATTVIDLGHDTVLQPAQGSVAAWVMFDSVVLDYIYTVNNTSQDRWAGLYKVNDKFGFIVYNNSSLLYLETTDTFSENEWHHVVMVGGSGNAMYVNGVEQSVSYNNGNSSTNDFLDDISSANKEMIGGRNKNGEGNSIVFAGMIDDVRVYDKKLSANEIKRLYGLGATTHIGTTINTNPNLEDGLVGHWTFDGKDMDMSSSTAEILDRSGSGNNGDWKNHATTTRPGKLGQAIEFDGVNDEIKITSSLSLGTNNFTFSGWMKAASSSGENRILFGNDPDSGSWQNNWMVYAQGNSFKLYTVQSSNVTSVNSTSNVRDNTWHHVTAVRNSTSHKIYVDGEEDSETIGTVRDISDTIVEAFSEESRGDWYHFDGSIDDVRVYDRALSDEEVKRLYELGATTHIGTTINTNLTLEDGLVGHWTFDGKDMDWNATNEALDRSGQGNDGNVTNFDKEGVKIGKIGQALELDGNNDYVCVADDASLDFTATDSFTVSIWAHANNINTGNSTSLISKWAGVDGYPYVIREDSTDGHVHAARYDGSNYPIVTLMSAADFTDGNWHLFAMVKDASTDIIYAYTDGVLVDSATDTTTGATANSSSLAFGTRGCTIAKYYEGKLDDARVYNRALSADEVKRLYEMGS